MAALCSGGKNKEGLNVETEGETAVMQYQLEGRAHW